MKLEEFNSKYEYVTDENEYGRTEKWTVMKEKDGKYRGDCEDYCLTLKKLVPEFKDWELYYCKINGGGHCVLHKNGDVIDCNVKRPVTLEMYGRLYRVTDWKKYHWFVVLSKRLIGLIRW